MVLRRWNNLILVRPFEAWATMLVKPDGGGEQWEETETENHAEKPSKPASSDMISSSPNPRYRSAGDELLTCLVDSTHNCWVDGEIGEEQNDMESSPVSRTLDACATKLRTVYCETCAHLSQAATACQNCEHVRELHFGRHFHDGAELTKVELDLLELKQSIFAGTKKAEKSEKTETETKCEKLWIHEEREKAAKNFERTQRKQAERARQILLDKEEQLRVHEARRLQEKMRAEREWEEKRAKFKLMQTQRERDYAQRRDEFLESRKLEKSLDYAQSYFVGCRGSLTQCLQTHGLLSLSHSSRADLQPERSLAPAPPLSPAPPLCSESNSKRMYVSDSQIEPHHDHQTSTGSRNSIAENIDGRCSKRRVAPAPSNMSISKMSHPKVTLFDAQVLQNRGLSSYSISSHRHQDEKEQGGGHGIQQTFSKLDRANSIMERLLNAHLIGDPALTGMRAMRKTQLKIDYAAACEQPVSFDVCNGVRPIGPSQSQAMAKRLKLAELFRYVASVLERNPGGCVGWFLSLDSDADGEVSTQDLVERLQQLPCALSEQQALEFVAGVMWRGRDIAGESRHPRRVQLSELWIALNIPDNLYLQTNGVIRDSSAIKHTSNFCPSSRAQANESLAWFHPKVGHCSMDGNSHLRADASCDKVYEDSMPGMTHDEFHREVRSMSELAARALSGVLQRQATLLHDIRKAKNNLCG